jgi:hypothetical protein
MSALDDVQRCAIKVEAGATGHPGTVAELFELGPFSHPPFPTRLATCRNNVALQKCLSGI